MARRCRDNGGGILASNFSSNAAFASASNLAVGLRDLVEAYWGTGDAEAAKTKDARLRKSIGDDAAPWLREVADDLVEGNLGGQRVTDFENVVTDIVVDLVRELPNKRLTDVDWAGMAGGTTTFLWAADPLSAKREIEERIAVAITHVQRAAVAVSG